MKKQLFYIEYYVFNLPLYLYHEMCHYIFLVITFFLVLNSFPRLKVIRWASCGECNDRGERPQYSFQMIVSYTNHWDFKVLDKMCAFMPIMGIIVLFILSPWYLYFWYLSHINTLWLSQGDINDITK